MYLQKCQLFNNTTITASQGIKCGVHLKIVSHEIPRRFDQKEMKMTLQFKVKIISLTALSAYRVGLWREETSVPASESGADHE